LRVVIILCLVGAGLFVADSCRNASLVPIKPDFYDTLDYARVAKKSLLSADFWFGKRSAGYPLLMKIVGTDVWRLKIFQTAFSAAAWIFLAGVVAASCRRRFFQAAGFLLVLVLALLPEVQLWNSLPLTESLSYSLFAWILGLMILYVRRPRKTVAAALLAAAFWLAITRDVYAYALLLAAGIILGVAVFPWINWRRLRIVGRVSNPSHNVRQVGNLSHKAGWLLLGLGLAFCALFSLYGQNRQQRWVYPLMNVIGRRILPDPAGESQRIPPDPAWVVKWQRLGAPLDEAVLKDGGKFGNVLAKHEEFLRWVHRHGQSAYLRFLLSRPGYFFFRPWTDREESLALKPTSITYYYASVDPGGINHTTGLKTNPASILTLCFWTFAAVMIFVGIPKRLPRWSLVPLVGAALCAAVILVSYHADAMEVERHCIPPAIQLYACLIITALAFLDAQFVYLPLSLWERAGVRGSGLDLPPSPIPHSAFPIPHYSFPVHVTYAALALLSLYVLVQVAAFSQPMWTFPWTHTTVFCILAGLVLFGAVGGLKWLGRGIDYVPIGAIIILALLLRLAWALGSGVTQTTDFAGYDGHALAIAQGGPWIYFVHPPGASVLYAIPYALFGHAVWMNQCLLALLSTLQVVLVYDIARRILNGPRSGKIAALVLAFWPEHIIYNNLLCSEVPYATFALLAVWLLAHRTGFQPVQERGAGCQPALQNTRRTSLKLVLLAGIALGLANWVRATAPLLLAAAAIYLLVKKNGEETFRRRINYAAALAGGFLLPSLVLAVLNYRDHGAFSIASSQRSGYNLLFGTSIEDEGIYNEADEKLVNEEIARRGIPPGADPDRFKDRVARQLGLWRLRQEPLEILSMAIQKKFPHLWGYPAYLKWSFETSRYAGWYDPVFNTALIYHLVMLGLTVLAVMSRRAWFSIWDERWILAAAAVLATLSHLVLEVQPRYHHAYLPVFALCIAGFGAAKTACGLANESEPNPFNEKSLPAPSSGAEDGPARRPPSTDHCPLTTVH
jgi:hypothetical protein